VNVIDEFHDRDPVADDDWWMGWISTYFKNISYLINVNV
jgi:hypothetical protein